MAVVRGGGEKEPVLELGREAPQHLAKLTVLTEGGRHQVVALVHDEEVPGKMRRPLRGAAGRAELLQHVRLAQVVIGGDDAAERAPGVRVHAEPAAQALGLVAVHHLESERELLPELLLPLSAERGRGEDEDPPDAAPEEKLGEDEPRLHRLPEADVVGDEKAHPRHAERLEERDELVALDAHAAVEGTRDGFPAERAFPVGVEVGRERRPAGGAEERVEVLGGHGAATLRGRRQRVRLEQMPVRLDLPQDAFLGRRAVVLVLDVDEMQPPRGAVEGLDGSHHPTPVADGREHPGPGDGDRVRR